jgi:methionine-rich copper-binding protein CopC
MQTLQYLSIRILVSMIFLVGLLQASASTTIISTSPANGATGVQPGASVVITFSTAMNTTETTAYLIDVTGGGGSPNVVPVWSAGNTVLTCTPTTGFANNHEIQWSVTGEDSQGNALTGTTSGNFTTVAGVNGGSGASPYTIYTVGRYSLYGQISSSAGLLEGYEFFGQTYLASNRTATAVTMTIPSTGGISNLTENLLQPQIFAISAQSVNQLTVSNKYPAGEYTFNVTGSVDQTAMVDLPPLAWPNEPVVTNYAAAQAVNPAQPFTLKWNTFTNGTSVDWILVQVQGAYEQTLFESPDYGTPNFLSGLSNSVVIPANALPPGTTNSGSVIFYFGSTATNGTTVTDNFVASATGFAIVTTGGAAGPPSLSIVRSGSNALLEWPTNSTGYTLEFATSLTSGSWSSSLPSPVVIGTNNVVTNAISGTPKYFRLAN